MSTIEQNKKQRLIRLLIHLKIPLTIEVPKAVVGLGKRVHESRPRIARVSASSTPKSDPVDTEPGRQTDNVMNGVN